MTCWRSSIAYILPLVAKMTVDDADFSRVSLVLATLVAVCLGYIYVCCRKEEALKYNVPLPPEVRPNWVGTCWDDVEGDEKRILEEQSRGVSF
jgi:hypothetical protein